MKLMDVIATPLARIDTQNSPLKEGPATVLNKVPLLSLICDECDIFAAARSGCPWCFRRVFPQITKPF